VLLGAQLAATGWLALPTFVVAAILIVGAAYLSTNTRTDGDL
jgi:hypothetical protein